ncbi:unnamed protein product [Linum tenue]|uniref:Uncharacterized protein n=1 Tax=Linum tenue TaxID=586396 RepID=A0AAV0R1L0_9ROSI|nr:unnamed protein product [Linum tenue]
MFHYGLLIWFTIPATNRPDTPLMVLSAFAITAQCAITITLICKLKAKRQKLFIIMFWMVFASLDAVIVVVTFLYYETHHERQLFLGDALIVSSFLTLVTTVVDMRVLRRPEEVKELSVVNSILGFAGALFMMIYGIL